MSLAEHVNNFSCACGGKDESNLCFRFVKLQNLTEHEQ